jgi:hypothetical protein
MSSYAEINENGAVARMEIWKPELLTMSNYFSNAPLASVQAAK